MEGEAAGYGTPQTLIGKVVDGAGIDVPSKIGKRPLTCKECQRSYARIDHLSRHLRAHKSEKPYACDVCFKSFSRSDLLKRHAQLHSLSAAAKPGSKAKPTRVSQACKGCTAAKVRCNEAKPCERCQGKGIQCEYANKNLEVFENRDISNNEREGVRQDNSRLQPDYLTPTSIGGNAQTSIDFDLHQDDSTKQVIDSTHNSRDVVESLDYATVPPSDYEDIQDPFLEYEDNELAEFLNEIMKKSNLNHEQQQPSADAHGATTPTAIYKNLFSFGLEENMELDEQDFGLMDYYQGKTPVKCIPPKFQSEYSPKVDLSTSNFVNANTVPIERIALGITAFRKSLWCWTPAWYDNHLQDQSSFTLQPENMASPESQFAVTSQVVSEKLGTEARDKLVAMILSTCNRSDFLKIMSSFPTAELLESLMHSFLAAHLAQSDTWIHLPTLRIDNQRPEFIGAIVSAGALLSTSSTIRKLSFAIQDSVRHSLFKTFEADNSLTRELDMLQAFVLNLDSGLWSGNKRNIELAESHASALTTMCRRANRFLRSSYPTIAPLEADEGAKLDRKWRAWTHQESWKRLIFHLFIRDAQTSISFLVNPSISYAELSLAFPESRKLWLAKNAHEWKAIYLFMKRQPFDRIPSLQQCIHDPSPITHVQQWIDLELSLSILSYAIWGLILEYTRLNSVLKAYPPKQTYGGILILDHRNQELCNLLYKLGVSSSEWREIEGRTPATEMLHELLLMHLHVSFDGLQKFAGREGEEEARRVYPSLQQWVTSCDARQAVWHAGQVIKAAKRLQSHQICSFNAIAIYHASLAFWAYGVLSIRSGHKPLSDVDGNAKEIVWLDGEENLATKMFITLQRGQPCFSEMGNGSREEEQIGAVARLSDPGDVMMVIVKMLRGHFGRSEQPNNVPLLLEPLPPLLENLCQLMKELGSAAKAVMGRV